MVIVCGDSAERLLAREHAKGFEGARYVEPEELDLVPLTWREARTLSRDVWGEDGMQVDLLVPRGGLRRPSGSVRYHVWSSEIPQRSLVLLEDGTVACSPQFNLLVQAHDLSDVEVCKRIMRMTAVYRVVRGGDDLPVCEPMVSRDLLETYLHSARHIHGTGRLLSLMRHAPSGARSPREICLTLPLVLPPRLGGCGLPAPRLNEEIPLDAFAKAVMGKQRCAVDLLWDVPGRDARGFALEYLGLRDHPNLGVDLARRLALQSLGYEVELVANEQLCDARQLDMIARKVARALGIDPNRMPWPAKDELQALIDEVLQD